MGIFAFVFASIMALVALMVFFYNRAAKEAAWCGLPLKWGSDPDRAVALLCFKAFYVLKYKAALRVASRCVNRMMLSCGLTPKTCRVRVALNYHDALKMGLVTTWDALMFIMQSPPNVEHIWIERVIRRGDVVQLWGPGTFHAFDGKRVAWAEWRQELGCDDNNWGWEFGFLGVASWPYGNAEGVKCRDFSNEDYGAAEVFKTLPAAQKLGIGQD